LEQTTSSVFPQLYLDAFVSLNKGDSERITRNVNAGIKRLRTFQLPGGGFSYWPDGTADGDENTYTGWASNYAGHFLVEAERRGYYVPPQMLKDWINHQSRLAQGWRDQGRSSQLVQAYRLYVLALASHPELGAMNRLREAGGLDNLAHWQLSAAYHLAGQNDVARAMANTLTLDTANYSAGDGTFGSIIRDQAIILDAMVSMGSMANVMDLSRSMSQMLDQGGWLSTQSAAFAITSLGKLVQKEDAGEAFSYQIGIGGERLSQVTPNKPISTKVHDGFPDAGEVIRVVNTSKNPIYVNVLIEGIRAPGDEEEGAEGLELSVDYYTEGGKKVDPSEFTQGDEFIARLRIANRTDRRLDNMALTYVIPSGWEILNPRMNAAGMAQIADVDYQDYRDDRVMSYFSLNPHKWIDIEVKLNAVYPGTYYLPGLSVEPMYDATKFARKKGQPTVVTRQ